MCVVDHEGNLESITETQGVRRYSDGAIEDGNGQRLSGDEIVSMNFWLFPSSFIGIVADMFFHFIHDTGDPTRDEYILPDIIDKLIRQEHIDVRVLTTKEQCCGMTYADDVEKVRNKVR